MTDSTEARDEQPSRPRGALALVGAWAELTDEEINALVRDIYSTRDGDLGRPVPELDEEAKHS